MKILQPTPETIAQAAAHLRSGQLVGMPTETVYGLAGNGLDAAALARIFDAKERPTFDPLILHVVEQGDLSRLVDESQLSPEALRRLRALTEAFWPGPLTLVLPKREIVPDLATSGLPTVAIRMPQHPIAQALIRAAGVPLAAPSANRFGRISPTRAEHVRDELDGRVEMVLDGGPCEIGIESTILKIDADGSLVLLRPGQVTPEQIAAVTGARPSAGTAKPGAQLAPGMLESHYAPTKRLLPLEQMSEESARRVGVLLLSGDPQKFVPPAGKSAITMSLSHSGDPMEMARNLFSTLRALDQSDAELLFCEAPPAGEGLVYAIADRLRRACAPRV